MLRQLIFLFCLVPFSAQADTSKTCDSQASIGECYENTTSTGQPMRCTSGIPSVGRNCPRGNDLGECRTVTVVSGITFTFDTFYYRSTRMCSPEMAATACTDRLKQDCLSMGDGKSWFGPNYTN